MLGTLIGIRMRWRMRVLRWVKQSLCSLLVLIVGWEDGEREGAGLVEGICWCYANRVCHIAVKVCHVPDRVTEVCRVAGHPVEVRCLAGHPVEVPHSTDRAVEVLCLVPPSVELRHVANCDVPCLPLGVRVLRFRCGLLLGPC